MIKTAKISTTILIVVLIIVVINILSDSYNFRIDLTEDKEYTLSTQTACRRIALRVGPWRRITNRIRFRDGLWYRLPLQIRGVLARPLTSRSRKIRFRSTRTRLARHFSQARNQRPAPTVATKTEWIALRLL